jgi:hypothetical protein
MKTQWEYDLVEKPFCEQLKGMGWDWLEGDTDVPELQRTRIGSGIESSRFKIRGLSMAKTDPFHLTAAITGIFVRAKGSSGKWR